jgi:SAM-dependent methyltransferase
LKRKLKAQASALAFGSPLKNGHLLEKIAGYGARLYSDSLGIAWFPPFSEERRRALDFGCGSGAVLRQLSDAGWEAIGIEPSVDAASRARQFTGCEVIVGTIPGVQLEKSSFDFVVLQHVLEHLPHPLATLKEIAQLVKPGGYMRITVPNFASLEARVLGESWYAMELPRHLYHFGKGQLTRYIESCGLHITRMQFSSEGWGLLSSLKHKWADPTTKSRKLAQVSSTVLARTLSVTGFGGVMTAYCRKPETER